ncbi:MAG: dephospho-CoA kinase, partial [Candidatus Kapabacteria bacterium]|nr:dephospho-CoA kinase [Candidatus Kapabacteria bacterium]
MKDNQTFIANPDKNVLVIAITGGIGSGKSEIGKILSEKGFPVISTDELAKSIMVGDTKVKLSLIDEFGQEVYDTSGKLNSKLLSEIVFKDDKYRQQR